MTQYTHNLALDLMIWNGIPLGLFALLLVITLFIRAYFRSSDESGFYFFTALSAILIHSMLEYPHAYAYFLILTGLFFGAGAFRGGSRDSLSNPIAKRIDRLIGVFFQRKIRVTRFTTAPVLIGSALLLSVVWYEYRLIEEDQRLLRFEAASVGTLKASQKAPDVTIIDQLQGFLWVARTHSFDRLASDERELIHAVAKRYPLPMPLLKRAQLMSVQGDTEGAVDSLAAIRPIYGEEAYKSTLNMLEKFQRELVD
jgi:hypothetical protein